MLQAIEGTETKSMKTLMVNSKDNAATLAKDSANPQLMFLLLDAPTLAQSLGKGIALIRCENRPSRNRGEAAQGQFGFCGHRYSGRYSY